MMHRLILMIHNLCNITEPGLVAFYDIRSGNGVGLFLQPWSPHGARVLEATRTRVSNCGPGSLPPSLWLL